ncbi:MAG TPA: S9 family peptidase [Anaerolineales bacterium]
MDDQKIKRQYGLWDSPVTPISLARGMSFPDVAWDSGQALAWLENRDNRGVLVLQPPDGQAPRDLNSEYSVRGKVGYGGGEFTLGHGLAYFADAASGRIYRQPLAGGAARPVTPAFGAYAAPKLSPDGRWLVLVHTYEGQDTLEVVDAAGQLRPQVLVSGEDFYMQPAWHPAGDRLAWIAWNHPNMPWDGTLLRLGTLRFEAGSLPVLQEVVNLAGGERTSVFQPEFSPDGRYLAYIADPGGWGQLYLHELATGQVRQLTQALAEHGAPAWIQGLRRYAFSPDGKQLYFLRDEAGFTSLWQIDLDGGQEQRLALDPAYTQLAQIAVSPDGGRIALLATGGSTPLRVITITAPGHPQAASNPGQDGIHVWRRSASEDVPAAEYSEPEPVAWEGMDGGTAYGLFYPPHSQHFASAGKPPLVIHVHGGPTSQVRSGFNPQAQFFATRGYAYLEVNFRGSTGYGREYQDALSGNWGVYDVQDAVSGGRALAGQGRVDPGRLVIIGGSAGGFTVLKALEDYSGFFKAGICLYGVSNQFSLAADTHKFEARYSDQLLGPLPEAAELYRERSPIFFADRISDPIAVFQGEIDPVVPRSQSDEIVAVLQRRGVPHIYHVYPGEGHGFRKVETIEHFYKTVDQFLKQFVIFA